MSDPEDRAVNNHYPCNMSDCSGGRGRAVRKGGERKPNLGCEESVELVKGMRSLLSLAGIRALSKGFLCSSRKESGGCETDSTQEQKLSPFSLSHCIS